MGASISTTSGRQSKLLGLGVHRPERVVTNDEICETIDSSDEWIQTRTGIKNRRFTKPEENVVFMAIEAGKKALAASGVSAEDIDTVIVATSTHLEQTPQAAAKVAHALGTKGPAAFDIGAGCAGFCYALAVASDLVKAGTSKYVLVIGAEQLSETTDPYDRTTRFIFADGAGAVVVGQSDETEIGPAVWGSDGSQADAIYQTIDWYDYITTEGAERPWIRMNGISVFRWAAFEMGKAAQKVIDAAGIKTEELHAFIPHQANSRITELLAKSLHLGDDTVVANDIEETGNTSAASIPLAMEELLRTNKAKAGDTALLLAFGAGLSYAGQVVKLPTL
ncbi:ketoacyl-ACP synthase III [Rhodococcus sp. PAMC28707]|uniref:beta-ketoacyl-ACP synthase III n=1 Tax=unclassified Rhodococcus (in: high G+C Gram-positive bacteria) TaxID=192944 RepID=UPI00109DAB85|nr:MULTISPECIES: beta-ketoacyl-ACP synthase III [unclassified Rhodococcus (in: high G+C Gram-positive bacteria)]QCB49507.1 ketoacyl-ACP synthase III [Rhodococcus sp. PAMC28705]QCB58803.1 ketoacyl-ACP synthase III [Rhodococcus sp. PAMC28707]